MYLLNWFKTNVNKPLQADRGYSLTFGLVIAPGSENWKKNLLKSRKSSPNCCKLGNINQRIYV